MRRGSGIGAGLTALALSCIVVVFPLSAASSEHAGGGVSEKSVDIAARGVDPRGLDTTVEPCEDFYRFVNKTWLAAHPIPADEPQWGAFEQVRKRTAERLHAILEEAAAANAPQGSELRKLGDFYASGMDAKARNAEGLKPLATEFERIEAINGLKTLQAEITRLQLMGVPTVVSFTSGQDFKHGERVIGQLSYGALGLPDVSYYTARDDTSNAMRKAYLEHVRRMFELAGEPPVEAETESTTVMAMETRFAEAVPGSITNLESIYHILDRKELASLAPHLDWKTYFAAMGHPEIRKVNVTVPDYFKALDRQLTRVPAAGWRTYLRWRLLSAAAPYLSEPFVEESLRFHDGVLAGMPSIGRRWERVVEAENECLGFALGRLYVHRYFTPSARARAVAILHNVRKALREDLATLSWMSPATRKAALGKLGMMVEKVGYPKTWPDYSGLEIDRGPYVLNVLRARAFELRRELDRIGKPLDRSRWTHPPQTVNAFYNPQLNAIFFPAAILQPPFFDRRADAATNYGALGAVMGHEITHGFDPTGSRFDGKGDLRNWWTKRDRKAFEKRVRRIVRQFSKYRIAKHLHVNGSNVASESIADLGGLRLAYKAFESTLKGSLRPRGAYGVTPEQRFFLAYARMWATKTRPRFQRLLAVIDRHPPPRFRVDGTLADMPAFARAWGCRQGPMVRRRPCVIW